MSGLFSSKKQTPEVSVVADPYKDIRESLNSWLQGQIGKQGATYPGEQVAPMSDYEQQSLGSLQQYANRGTPSSFTAGKKMIEDTLAGNYDPTRSPYYQSIKAEAMRNLQDTQSDIADQAAGGGAYWSGARLSEQRKAGTDVANSLNTVLGSLAEKERQNQLSMIPYAQEYAQTEEEAPLRTTAALQEYGALPRTIQQAYQTALYNEWLNSQQYPLTIARLASQVQQPPVYAQAGYGASPFMSIFGQALGGLAQGIGSNLFSKSSSSKK